jgi:hypothetical protein
MLQFPLYISLIAGTASLALGYLEGGYVEPARWIIYFGAFWLVTQASRWRWFAPIGLFAALTCAGYGIWIDLSASWMFAGALGALFAWDLSDFKRRLEVAAPEGAAAVIRRHLLRLGFISGAGLTFSLLRMFYWWEVYADALAYLSMLAAAGASLVWGRTRSENQ